MRGLLLTVLCLGLAQAHNLDINQAAIQVEHNKALLIVAPPSSMFKVFDDNRDGLLSVKEVEVHREALGQMFDEQVSLSNENNQAGQAYFADIIVPGAFEGQPEGSNHLRFMRRYGWEQAPKEIRFAYGLFADGAAQLSVTVALGEHSETVLLNQTRPQHTFSGKAQQNPLQYLRLGLEHILGGYDHLLFLLALILAARTLVNLMRVITAFTVAHSIALALSVLGVIALPPYLVEGVIALSIAYVALENFLRPGSKLHRRWLAVFAFGLIHGLGFSGVIKEIGLPQSQLVTSLLNFNLGVELGQVVFVLVVWAMLDLVRRVKLEVMLRRWGSIGVAGIALFWLVERFFF
jgi:hydrogenase/urease accessory protein HupE